MEYQRILTIGMDKAIFGAPSKRLDSRACQPLTQIDRDGANASPHGAVPRGR
jgi:hypothetical protein